MYLWVCKMFYGDKLYSGLYWGDEMSLARARKEVKSLQRFHPSMRFELSDYKTGNLIKLN